MQHAAPNGHLALCSTNSHGRICTDEWDSTFVQGGWGTENYIIPLGAGYIEIAAVWDPEAAQSCDWGKCAFLSDVVTCASIYLETSNSTLILQSAATWDSMPRSWAIRPGIG